MKEASDQITEDEKIPDDVDIDSLGECRRCNCKEFVQVSGSIKCGRSTCKHHYNSHGS